MNYFDQDDDYSALSIADLLVARDEFHLHLVHKANVVGTAIGRYRIRKTDPWPDSKGRVDRTVPKGERTLQNSEVRSYSWPAILVFVTEWVDYHRFTPDGDGKVEDFVPPTLFMSDGRKVPVCVVKATKSEIRHPWDANYTFPTNLLGGGFPLLVDVQNQEHIASAGCLVTDGHRTYVLTNRHVAGEAGTPIHTLVGGNKVRIGTATNRSLTKAGFTSVYEGWRGKNVYIDLDAALVDIDDVNQWTTQIYGIGEIGKLADLSSHNLSLRLVGCPVRAFGAASKAMHGEIAALFYRFKSVGGFEYVSDFLIGPRNDEDSLGTHPGDSGTVWLVDDPAAKLPIPVALQWGGQVFEGAGTGTASSYALATALSTICASLDVDLVRGWNADNPEYWGAVGHYGIANKAIGRVRAGNLRTLMDANLQRITLLIEKVTKTGTGGFSKQPFVPLADVPDLVWKIGPYKRGGPNSPEHANHFADMDRKLKTALEGGKTLLEICTDPSKVDVEVWRKYYDAVQRDYPGQDENRGLLPFRVWQIFDAMVYFLGQKDVERFLCAAGILSHYVGDACQPLHISYLFNGDPDRGKTVPGKDRKGNPIQKFVPFGAGVHSAYEDDMVDNHVDKLWPQVDDALKALPAGKMPESGREAAREVVKLMQATFADLHPMDIVNAYAKVMDEQPKPAAEALWKKFGTPTAKAMASGSDCLARLWQGAWKAGKGDAQVTHLGEIPTDRLAAIYQRADFLRSCTLDTIGPVLETGTGGEGQSS
jgi:hypothetical protein